MNCKHEFIGSKNGVRCKLCGLYMTPERYREYIHPPDTKQAEKQPQKRGRKAGKP